MDKLAILDALGQRSPRWGICKASAYVNGFAGCLGDGFCPTQLLSVSKDAWAQCLKDADSTLTFADPSLLVKSVSESDIPDGGILAFDCIITTTRKDRDGDILESSGAMLDLKMPLLWQHLSIQPIGKFLQETGRSRKSVGGRFAIADVPLGRDAATLVKFGALRISHGFEPQDFEPMYTDDEEIDGWRVKKFTVMETSVVSIPSNIDAEILTSVAKSKSFAKELDGIRTAFGQNRLETDAVKSWAKRVYENRPAQGRGAQLELPVESHACTCGKTPSSATDGAQVTAGEAVVTVRLDASELIKSLEQIKDDKPMCKCPECGYSGQMDEFQHDGKATDVEARCFAALMKDANRMRVFRDRLTTVLDAQSQREWAEGALDELLAAIN